MLRRSFSSSLSKFKHLRRPPPPPLPSPALKTIKESITRKLRSRDSLISDQQADVFNSVLAQIRRAVAAEDPTAVHELWIKLRASNLAHLVDPKLLSSMSGLLLESHLPRDDIEDLALAAASFNAEDFAACMLYHIRSDQPEATLSLYSRSDHIMQTAEDEHSLEFQDDLAFGHADLLQSPSQSIRGRILLLMAAVTAHAMLDSFQGALNLCKDTDVRFHHHTTNDFLERLKYNPDLKKKVEAYVHRLHYARLVSRPPSLSRHITNLGDTKALSALKKFYDGIIQGILGPSPFIAADESFLSSERTVAMTFVGWTSFLTAFLKCSAKDDAARVWDDIPKLGLRHHISMWNALLAGQSQSFTDATATFNTMKTRNIQPNALTYRALIGSLFNGRRPNLAMDKFHEFRRAELNDSPEDIMAVYNTVVNGLLVTNRVDAANSLLLQMSEHGPNPDVVSYNTFLGHFARRNDLKGLGMIMTKMGESGVAGDVFSFSTILSALLKLGRPDASEIVFRLMNKQGVKANTATYTAIIDQQMRTRDEVHLNGALKLLSQMEGDPAVAPNIVTYTSVLAGLYRGPRWLSEQKEHDFTRSILERMKRHNVKLNTRTYNILLKACLQNDRLDQALSYYQEMKRTKVPMFHETWYVLLDGMVGMNEWDIAKEVVKDMGLYGVRPLGPLQNLIQRAVSGGRR
ncbi:hypothetical protein D9757_005378 [Collybiopsis confluens]|uniref:PROP1-like PPR domain-containing protein n=1 Tax=Collybiopsis confluens TaxID=2823264 RepID=A0A8H5HLF5_9AGAR|nr:hypothetical protein D9757_005378 [Collybiopsis confluens]